ncbi:hypothetical protein GALMADRAFT_260377 [Galerina marginata CBS 339.88]|uniref:DUF6699 domain-containing protein n=1 Tax=Galerina marginata (strain CBS 339.88) TaxID=685588 RepID=A0A067SE31_GALM3|nr:hypothetical protein GALMADRAFT_260377 [Galerina marginata CBS 339.88]
MLHHNFKHVRFTDQNIFYSPPPANHPSLSYSGPTVARSTGNFTYRNEPVWGLPRSLPYGFSTSTISRNSGCVHLHRYLEMSSVNWNLLDPPSTITRDHRPIQSRMFLEPATHPPLSVITIISPYLPWIIKVHASHRPYLTVGDVFNAVYRYLRTNITKAEFNSLRSVNSLSQQRATCAYEWRYRRHRDARVYRAEKNGGMKRVDLLMGNSRFIGISNTCCLSDEWQLNVTW